jgi:hypothetical protein
MSSSQTPARAASASAPKTYTEDEKNKLKAELKAQLKEARMNVVDKIIDLKFKIEEIENDINELKSLKLDSYTDIHRTKIEKIKARISKLDALKSEIKRLSKIAKNLGGGKTTKHRIRRRITQKRYSV